jgi:AcrR family transcriptional regulator
VGRTRDPQREAQRRQEIMATCYRLLSTTSHQAMTLEAVAKELGGSKGQIAHYFPSKEALITATIRSALELYGQVLMAVAESQTPLPERLEQVIQVALPDPPDLNERFNFIVEVWSFAKSSRETRAAVRSAFESMRQITRRMLQIGVQTGFITKRHVERQVVPIAALFDGLLLHAANGDADVGELRGYAREVVSGMLGIVKEPPASRAPRGTRARGGRPRSGR